MALPPCPDGPANGRLGLGPAARRRRGPRRPHRPGPGDWLCRPARTVQDAGGSDRDQGLAGVGDPPPSPARAGDWHCRPAGRCKTQVTRIAVGDCEPDAGTSPGRALARAARPVGVPARSWPSVGRLGLGPEAGPRGRRLTPAANRRVSRCNLASLQSTGPPANLGGRRPTCKGHAPTYSRYTVSGH